MDLNNKRIIISRTDSIGDVMLTLPVCKWLKDNNPGVEVIFLGKGYTKSVVEHYSLVDRFVDWNDIKDLSDKEAVEKLRALNADVILHIFPVKAIARLAKKASIEMRIGTSHRIFHFLTCNYKVNFTRKGSDLHESQLNHELLRPLGLKELPEQNEIIVASKFLNIPDVLLPEELQKVNGFTILHPKSQGSAKEWPIEKYMTLASELASDGKAVIFTGTKDEGDQFRHLIPTHDLIIDSTGKLSLEQLMVLISKADNLVACSTGPLHIAGYYSVNTIGLFSPKRPIHPGRWKAIGENVTILVSDEACPNCRKGLDCNCILDITVDAVKQKLK